MNKLHETFDFFERNSNREICRSELIGLVEVLLSEKGMGKSTSILKEFYLDDSGIIDFEKVFEFSRTKLGIIDN